MQVETDLTEALVDLTGEDVGTSAVTQTTLRTALTSTVTTVETDSAVSISKFPDSGVLLIGS